MLSTSNALQTRLVARICLLLLTASAMLLVAPASAQDKTDPFATSTAGPIERHPERVSAGVLLVKADWSQVAEAESVRTELETLLQGSELPESYRANLLRSAPKILFSAEVISLYDRKDFVGLLLWLQEHDLIREGQSATADPDAEDLEVRLFGTDERPRQRVLALLDEQDLPIETLLGRSDEPPPFVKRTYVSQWLFDSFTKEEAEAGNSIDVSVSFAPELRSQFQNDGDTPVDVDALRNPTRAGFRFPTDKVAVLNMLSYFSAPDADLIRRHGWEPLWMIFPDVSPLRITGKSNLAKPSALTKIRLSQSGRGSGWTTRRPPSTPTPQTPPADTPRSLKIFHLQFSEAAAVGDVLKQLIDDSSIVIDNRTNSIIMRGSNDSHQIAEALMMQLDARPAEKKAATEPAPQWRAEDKAELESTANKLREEYWSQELEAGQFAWRLEKDLNATSKEEARSRLSKIVTEAFSLRQQLQQTEVKLLRERIRAIETQLERRAKLQNQIIKHRVDQLLSQTPQNTKSDGTSGPAKAVPHAGQLVSLSFDQAEWRTVLTWLAKQTGQKLQVVGTPPGTVTYKSPRNLTAEEAWNVIGRLMPEGWAVNDHGSHFEVRAFPRGTTKPKSMAAASGPTTRPGSAVVWVEALLSKTIAGGAAPQRFAVYSSGAIVSPHGLVLVAFSSRYIPALKGETEAPTISVFLAQDKAYAARVVALDDEGLALLKIDATGLPYVECGATIAMGQLVRCYTNHELQFVSNSSTSVRVAGVPGNPKEVPSGRFEVGGNPIRSTTGVIIANDGKLVGLLSAESRSHKPTGHVDAIVNRACITPERINRLLKAYSQGQQPAGAAGGLPGSVQIEFLPKQGLLILRGTRDDVEGVKEAISEIDAPRSNEVTDDETSAPQSESNDAGARKSP